MNTLDFAARHIGPDNQDIDRMLKVIGVPSIDALIDKTIPESIRRKAPLNIPAAQSEFEYLKELKALSLKNKVCRSYIGMGYYGTITPGVVLRNIFENPGWYTAYTPYQAEIAQGRLEALLNYQTLLIDLTGMDIANASLLDEATAASEAMHMFHANRPKEVEKRGANKLFVSNKTFPQTIDVLMTRAEPLEIELVIGDFATTVIDESFFGAIVQYPDGDGQINNYKEFAAKAKALGLQIGVAADLLSLVLIEAPGVWGADVVFGSSQRFGVPMGFGGPHAAYFAAKEDYKRIMPGRIIGVSVDANGNRALRMALQTREQHIRRDKATSNICTAQVLLAVIASMYAVYHGPKGLKQIASDIHTRASKLNDALKAGGVQQLNASFFDTLKVKADEAAIKAKAEANDINFRYFGDGTIGISIDETVSDKDLVDIAAVFGCTIPEKATETIASSTYRKDEVLTHPVFNVHHSETEMLRYIKKLENKDLSLAHAMIPLGSCTMKLNATSEMAPLSWPEFSTIHPFAPSYQVQGYLEMIHSLENYLAEITGFAGVSLQPNSGAQGEYAGLISIRAFHQFNKEGHRNICLIPSSAHGTNPASAVMAGMKVVVTKCDENGNVDVNDLREKAILHKDNLSCLMITYPSTHGVYEESIREITTIIHENGGQVYMDGANMNAQVGLTSPGLIGADVCHLNLHKTFAIPHGGGGPGMGPIGVAKHLVPFLPGHSVVKLEGEHRTTAVSAAPYGSASILLISYGYIRMLGSTGVTDSTKLAIFNANYIKARLEKHYPVLYVGKNGTVAHEMILDCRQFKTAGIEVEDIAKRLMDYGFHAPTMSFPVAGTVMVEPTESEPLIEIDRFCEAMIKIRQEIEEVITGAVSKEDNVLKHAPHTMSVICANDWTHSYSREKAAFPSYYSKEVKFWPMVGRVDNAYGDRNLICSCPSIESYEEVMA